MAGRAQKGFRYGGRQKGSLNKSTIEIKATAKRFLENPSYISKLKKRLEDGTAPQIETLLYYYAYGKPKERIEHTGEAGGPLKFTLSLGASHVNGQGEHTDPS